MCNVGLFAVGGLRGWRFRWADVRLRLGVLLGLRVQLCRAGCNYVSQRGTELSVQKK